MKKVILVCIISLAYTVSAQNKDSIFEIKAWSEFSNAEKYMLEGDENKAFFGSDSLIGMQSIIEQFDSTKAANLSRYYLGIYLYKKRNYEGAIQTLSRCYTPNTIITSVINGVIGDCYAATGNLNYAIVCYEDAALTTKNELTSSNYLHKIAFAYELMGNYQKSIYYYILLQNDYPFYVNYSAINETVNKLQKKLTASD